jgi:hypothetical protein
MPQVVPLIKAIGSFDELGLGKLGQALRVVDLVQTTPQSVGMGTLSQVLQSRAAKTSPRAPYLTLGTVSMDMALPDGHSVRDSVQLAEQALIERKPRLQWTGDALTEHEISFRLHEQFGDVNTALASLDSMRLSHAAQALVMWGTKFLGYFVVATLEKTFLDQRGDVLVHATGTMTLKEFVPTAEELQKLGTPTAAPAVVRQTDQAIPGLTQIEKILRNPAKSIVRLGGI